MFYLPFGFRIKIDFTEVGLLGHGPFCIIYTFVLIWGVWGEGLGAGEFLLRQKQNFKLDQHKKSLPFQGNVHRIIINENRTHNNYIRYSLFFFFFVNKTVWTFVHALQTRKQ